MATAFSDRADAGAQLAQRLMPLRERQPIVVALPRGGVPVAREIAAALGAPLDVLAVRKLGAPSNPELGMGAVAEDGTGVIDQATVSALGVTEDELQSIIDRETAELRRRVALYRGERPAFDLAGRTVIVVDDGVATGVTDTAALRAVRRHQPEHVVLAVPVCAPEVADRLADGGGRGRHPADASLRSTASVAGIATSRRCPTTRCCDCSIPPTGTAGPDARGDGRGRAICAFRASCSCPRTRSGSSSSPTAAAAAGTVLATSPSRAACTAWGWRRCSSTCSPPRNRTIAPTCSTSSCSASAWSAATRWVARRARSRSHSRSGYFGASTGAAAALIAAAELPAEVGRRRLARRATRPGRIRSRARCKRPRC